MKRLFYNGTVLDSDGRSYDWLLTEDRFIKAKGFKDDMPKDNDCEKSDLCGKTLIPAIIDPHSHLTSFAVSLLQTSLEKAKSFDDIVNTIREFIEENQPSKDEFIVCAGYDQNRLKEGIHPTNKLLDEAFPGYAIVLHHVSGHMGVMSTEALKKLGITGDKDGLLQENDFISNVKRMPLPSGETLKKAIIKAQNIYASYGIATAQEGMIAKEMIPIFKMAEEEKLFFLDVLGYVDLKDRDEIFSSFPQCSNDYHNHLKLPGLKIFLDGSPQGKTAWMREPYEGEKDGYCGFGTMKDDDVIEAFNTAIKSQKQLIAHCNGDAAADQLLKCASMADNKEALKELRPVVIHSQLLSPDIMPKLKELGFLLSFFPAHIYYWGETHVKNFGINRAERLSSLRSAKDAGLNFTLHQDTPVLPPNLFRAMESAVVRKTQAGRLLGEKEKLTALEALQAVTINAAYQYHEEAFKGSLSEGKYADIAVLEENPLTVEPEKLAEMKVFATFKEGKKIYPA